MHTLKKDINCANFIDKFDKTNINTVKEYQKLIWNDDNIELEDIKANLPEGYLQTRTFQVSYQAWRRIYQQRYNHRLEEWSKDIVKFIESLPFSKELITII